jgi:hypothetical protein
MLLKTTLLNRPPRKGGIFALDRRRETLDEILGITESRPDSNEFVETIAAICLQPPKIHAAIRNRNPVGSDRFPKRYKYVHAAS